MKREVTRWSSHSEAMLQAALDDVDWDMFRASSSDVSEFTDVAVSFVNMLTEQATETITVRSFPNQKLWVDRTICDAVNKRTAAYNKALLSGNMSEYKALCYALRRAVSAAKHRYCNMCVASPVRALSVKVLLRERSRIKFSCY